MCPWCLLCFVVAAGTDYCPKLLLITSWHLPALPACICAPKPGSVKTIQIRKDLKPLIKLRSSHNHNRSVYGSHMWRGLATHPLKKNKCATHLRSTCRWSYSWQRFFLILIILLLLKSHEIPCHIFPLNSHVCFNVQQNLWTTEMQLINKNIVLFDPKWVILHGATHLS